MSTPPAGQPLPLRDAGRSRAQMDTLRFGAIFLIMIHHFYFMEKPVGTIGTHFFFALTGFLIANTLMKLREQVQAGEIPGWKAAWQFTTRRWMRVIPIMWLMLTLVFLFFRRSDRPAMIWHYLLLSNIRMARLGYYPDYIAHLWWISAMEQLLPFIILLFMLTPKHHLQKALACMILIGPAFRLIGYHYRWNYVSMRVLPPAFIDIVGLGCLLAVAMKHKNEHLIKVIKFVGLWIGLPAMLFAVWYIQKTDNDLSKSLLFDLGSTWAVCWLIIVSYNGIPGVIGNILAWPPLVYLGAIQYGLAMWHLSAMGLVIAFMMKFCPNIDERLTPMMVKHFPHYNFLIEPHIRAVASFGLAVIVASLTYRFIELPVSKWKHAGDKPKPVRVPKAQPVLPSDLEDVELAK